MQKRRLNADASLRKALVARGLTAAERGVGLGQAAGDVPVAVVPVDDVSHRVAAQRAQLLLRHGVVPQPQVVDVPVEAVVT